MPEHEPAKPVADPASKGPAETPAAPPPPAQPAAIGKRYPRLRRWIMIHVVIFAVVAVLYVGVPIIKRALNTVSTDDAYVNGHVTFTAARVPGQVTKVLVDDNNRVRRGDLIVQLDPEPYQIQVSLKQAAYDLAKADLAAAHDEVRGIMARARSSRYLLDHSIEQVDNQIALLRANVAALATAKARLVRALADNKRATDLQKQSPGAISQREVDQAEEAFRVADAQVNQALENVHQIRVGLGLPATPASGDLAEVPPDLNQNFSSVRQALAELIENIAPLGYTPSSLVGTPKEAIAEFYKQDPQGNLDRIYARLEREAPAIQQAAAKLEQAKSDLDQAKLNLRYCNVWAEIDGVVTRRNVNPGNNVQAGQSLMAIRSLTEIWIDANFKETQLANLRIGQRVEMEVDLYGSKKHFEGRITGFTMGTGSTLAILPAENATGNFIKVVQRLPVRIEPVNYDPDHNPLFIGLSVVPYVYIKEPATGPHAGQVLQPDMTLPKVDPSTVPQSKPAPAQGNQP